jgi:sec-independent protein translocase protein TatA
MLAFFNAIQPMHVLLLLVVALLLFGNRLPDVARSIGRAFNEFKRGLRDVNDDLGREDQRRDPSPTDAPKLSAPVERPTSTPPAPGRTSQPAEARPEETTP